MKQSELKSLIKLAIEKDRRFCDTLKGEDNPVVIAEIQKASGRIVAFEAVLDAINGKPAVLKISAAI